MAAKLAVGDAAPAFDVPGTDGKTAPRSLASYAGKALVLYFYPKDDTSGCTAESIDFSKLKGAFHDAGAEVIGVSPDSTASHDKFRAKHNLDLTLLSDETKEMLGAYGVWAEKSMYGRKYMGVERTTFLIDKTGRIARIWEKVKVPGHAAAVLEAVKAL